MFQAGIYRLSVKLIARMLVAFATGVILAQLQPAAYASSSVVNGRNTAQAESGSASAVAECSASKTALVSFENYLPQVKYHALDEKLDFVAGMVQSQLSQTRQDTASYASPRNIETAPVASGEAVMTMVSNPQIITAHADPSTVFPPTVDLDAELLLQMINNHRVEIGLQALQKDDRLMEIARNRAPQIFDEIFVTNNMHAGFYALNLPYWATENIIYFNTEEGAYTWWLNSTVHRSAIESSEYTYTGIACSGRSCSQIFSSFQPKAIIATEAK